VVGAEALLRWEHPTRGTLLPAQFLHLADESGAVVPIGDWVLAQACTEASAWLASGVVDRSFSVHVNISPRQLQEGTFVERVLSVLRSHDLNPAQLTLDFDEATLNDDTSSTKRALQALRRFGVRIALDDFGIGVSSLTALRDCSADIVKLDGTVARGLGANGEDDPLVRAIIQFAHALDKQVVATSLPETGSNFFDPALPDLAAGETVTYRLTATLSEGTQRLVITDRLPAGLVAEQARLVSVAPGIVAGAPAIALAPGTVTFDFGTVVNRGDNAAGDTVVVEVTARRAGEFSHLVGTGTIAEGKHRGHL
jgi:EAL domain-containing protein (putative c-di-GMP-specific phosphodiesterase class I)